MKERERILHKLSKACSQQQSTNKSDNIIEFGSRLECELVDLHHYKAKLMLLISFFAPKSEMKFKKYGMSAEKWPNIYFVATKAFLADLFCFS